jgi:hypothetical protein
VGKYGAARQATDDNIVRHMRFEYWVTEVTDPHSEYVMLNVFPRPRLLHESALIFRL